jgi:hypothetical protein
VRRLLVVVVVLALLLVVADRVAAGVAERQVAQTIQESEGLADRPEVDIAGIPFLTQALRGDYRQIDVTIHGLTAEQDLTIDELDGRLNGVRVPLRDVVQRSVSSAPVDLATATGRTNFDALNEAAKTRLPSDRLTATFGAGSAPDRLSVTGSYASPVGAIAVRGEARIVIQDGDLVVTAVPDSLSIPSRLRDVVARLLDLSFRLPDLPFGFQARSVAVSPEGIAVTATARDVTLGAR